MPKPALDLRGARVLLRPWHWSDLAPLAALNADPLVMEHCPALLTRAQSDALVCRLEAHFAAHGFGHWAVEVPGVTRFVGLVGLFVLPFQASFTPAVEIGWHLAREHWGKGYAVEAASVALRAAFGPLGMREIVALSVPGNVRSRRVMDRLGMSQAAVFEHPLLPEGHRLRRHALHRLTREEWRARTCARAELRCSSEAI